MINPDFSVRTAEPMTDAERKKWGETMVLDFRERGAVFWRTSMNSWEPKACIVEGWLQHLKKEDLPPAPRHF